MAFKAPKERAKRGLRTRPPVGITPTHTRVPSLSAFSDTCYMPLDTREATLESTERPTAIHMRARKTEEKRRGEEMVEMSQHGICTPPHHVSCINCCHARKKAAKEVLADK